MNNPHLRDVLIGEQDDGYLIRLFAAPDSADEDRTWVDFQVIQVFGESLFAGAMHPVKDIEDAVVLAEGFVKWDGCTQFTVDAHIDHKRELDAMFNAIGEARRLASEVLDGWDEDSEPTRPSLEPSDPRDPSAT